MLRRFKPLSSRKNRSYWSSMYSSIALKLSELSMASPKPGVSTTVKRSLTPRSSISTVDASSFTVCFCFSKNINFLIKDSFFIIFRRRFFFYLPIASGIILSGYKSVRNKLFTRVDLPKPDSPTTIRVNSKPFLTDFLCT